MDIHEQFSYQVSKLYKLVEDIKRTKKQIDEADSNTVLDDNYLSEWDRFSGFLKDLVTEDYGDRFKKAIFWLLFDNEELDLHEQVEQAFDYFTDYDGKILKSIVYTKEGDEITVKYNEIEYPEEL